MRPPRFSERLAVWVLLGFGGLALGADLIASDLPLAARVDGHTYLLPCLTHPVELRRHTQTTLGLAAEWLVRTPIAYGPQQPATLDDLARASPPPWPPEGRHWLGSDELGRDVLARLIHGARVSLFIALVTVVISVGLGVTLGAAAGFFRGPTDLLVSRVIEVMTTFPTVFFLIALMAVLRTQSVWPLVLVLGLTRWPEMARLARAEALALAEADFVLAARALGASGWRIVFRHVVPNVAGPVIVAATFAVGHVLLLESALSFLGLGVPPPTPSWGELLTEAHRTLIRPGAWWLALFPGLAIAAVVLSVNSLGERLRRAFARPGAE